MQSAGDSSDNASTLRYLPPACFAGIAAAAAKNAAVPVALHLDHGDSLELVKECLDAGYTSVMFERVPAAFLRRTQT